MKSTENPSYMKRWPSAAPWLERPKNVLLTLVAALLLTMLIVLPIMRWMSTSLVNGTPRSDPSTISAAGSSVVDNRAEPWPTPPATFVPMAVAAKALQDATPRPTPTTTPLPPPTWEEMNYLTSVKFTTSSIVDAQRTTTLYFLGDLVTDQILLKAVGNVQVGIDLAEVADVKINGSAISFRAPKPEVTSIELLPERSQIYSTQQVIFLSQYKGLEKDALQKARLQLRDEIANNESMMKLAEEMARLQLTDFLHKVGFDKVTIKFE